MVVQHVALLSQTDDVQDQSNRTVAHNGRAGVGRNPFQMLPERLDDDLLRISNRIEHQSVLPVFGLQYGDVHSFFAVGPFALLP